MAAPDQRGEGTVSLAGSVENRRPEVAIWTGHCPHAPVGVRGMEAPGSTARKARSDLGLAAVKVKPQAPGRKLVNLMENCSVTMWMAPIGMATSAKKELVD